MQGQVLDAARIDDLYEIKASMNGQLSADQRNRLKLVLNGGNANGSRQIKPALSPKLFAPETATFTPNPRYRNGFKLLGMIGVALGTAQTAHAVWTFDAGNDEFQELIAEAKLIRRQAVNGKRYQEPKLAFRGQPHG